MDGQISQQDFPVLGDPIIDTPVVEAKEGQLELFSLQELTINNSNTISVLKEQIKTTTEMVTEALEASEAYRQTKEEIKEKQRILNQTKASITQQPSISAQVDALKNLRQELKEKKAEISDYAMEVFRMTGANEFEKDGEIFDIVTSAKLVKRHE